MASAVLSLLWFALYKLFYYKTGIISTLNSLMSPILLPDLGQFLIYFWLANGAEQECLLVECPAGLTRLPETRDLSTWLTVLESAWRTCPYQNQWKVPKEEWVCQRTLLQHHIILQVLLYNQEFIYHVLHSSRKIVVIRKSSSCLGTYRQWTGQQCSGLRQLW